MNIYQNSILFEENPQALKTMSLAFDGIDPNIPEDVERYISIVPQVRTDGRSYLSVVFEARDRFLSESDWVIVKAIDQSQQSQGSIEIPKVWLEYRQNLRDIPEQAGFPYDIAWPVKP